MQEKNNVESKQNEKKEEDKPIIEVDLAEEQAKKDFIKIRNIEIDKEKKDE